MKYVRKFVFLLLCLSIITNTFGQKYTHDLKGIKKVKIIMSGSSDVEIEASDKMELLVYSTDFDDDYDDDDDDDDDNDEEDKRDGMKAIYSSGYDNSGVGLSIKVEGGVLIIKKMNPMSGDDYTFVLPRNMSISYKNSLSGDVQFTGFSGEIEAQMLSGNISLREVTGPVLANAISGDITAIFSKVAQQSPMSLISISGDVEISLPADSKVNLVMETTSGTSFTNMDLKITKNKVNKENEETHFYSSIIKSKINGGGVKILAKSISGDVLIRQKKG